MSAQGIPTPHWAPVASQWSVGLDVGGTKVLGVLLDADGVVRHQLRSATVGGAAGVVDTAVAVVEELCAGAGIPVGELAGVGIGLPGVVDPSDGTVEHAVNLGIEERTPLGALVAERLGVRVRVENDLTVAVVGAAHTVDGGHASTQRRRRARPRLPRARHRTRRRAAARGAPAARARPAAPGRSGT